MPRKRRRCVRIGCSCSTLVPSWTLGIRRRCGRSHRSWSTFVLVQIVVVVLHPDFLALGNLEIGGQFDDSSSRFCRSLVLRRRQTRLYLRHLGHHVHHLDLFFYFNLFQSLKFVINQTNLNLSSDMHLRNWDSFEYPSTFWHLCRLVGFTLNCWQFHCEWMSCNSYCKAI